MEDLTQLNIRLQTIEDRNIRVEKDKAWETSKTRIISIIAMTYALIVLFMYIADIKNPWINAIVPSVGFWLSTLTLPMVKNIWIRKQTNNLHDYDEKTAERKNS